MRAETAQDQLEAFRVEDWLDRRMDRAARLPGKLRGTARAILGCDTKGNVLGTYTKAQHDAQDRGLEQLDALSERDRGRIFDALFPQLGRYVEQAWQLHRRLPYQFGWERLAFRAPNTLETIRPARRDWLLRLLQTVEGYEQDITWYAAWAPHLGLGAPHRLGVLFAGAVDAGGTEGDAVFDILIASARGEHEIGTMGRHVTRGLLIASRPDGWAVIEQLLLAAQRQEGLRQVILETVDEAHPEAFRRLLRLILENKLTRFSATIRAVDVWFGAQWEVRDARVVNDAITSVLSFLDDSASRVGALESGDPQSVYLALWSMAFDDAIATVEPASRLLGDSNVERRFAATHLLSQLGLVRSLEALLDALGDEDLRVVTRALMAFRKVRDERILETDFFERIEQVVLRFPAKKKELQSIIWPWMKLSAERKMATSTFIWSLGERSPTRLIPYLTVMGPQERTAVVGRLAEMSHRNVEVRDTLLILVGDRSNFVRAAALKALAKHKVTARDAEELEALLTRKTADLRRGVISLLLTQNDGDVLTSVERLLGSSNASQRLAGLELLRQMTERERSVDRCHDTAAQFHVRRSRPASAEEDELLDHILDKPVEAATLDDALGLLEPTERTLPTPPKTRRRASSLFRRSALVTPAAIACLESLDALVHQHRATTVTLQTWRGEQDDLLGNAGLKFPIPRPELGTEENVARLPARQLWETWSKDRPQTLRDKDGLELLRASAALYRPLYVGYQPPSWLRKALNTLFATAGLPQLKYPVIVPRVLIWLNVLHMPTGAVDLMLDGIETTFGLVPEKELKRVADNPFDRGWRSSGSLLGWLELARYYRSICPGFWDSAQRVRLWRLLRWMDEPGPPVPRHRPQLEEVLAAFEAGGATRSDLLDHLLGPRGRAGYTLVSFPELRQLTGHKPSPLIEKHPVLGELVDACRDRILQIELARGEMPTAASGPATALRHAGGLDVLISVLKAIGKEKLIRGWTYDSLSKANVFSHLMRATTPSDSDTLEVFCVQAEAAKIPQQRLVELAVYAPQWAVFVERALDWPGLADAVWWLHAHTKDTRWQVDQEIRELWNAQITEHTPLSAQQLLDGAVDVAWFMRAYRALGPERWEPVYKAAKLASGGGGHKRAQLFADAMLGRIDKADLISRITEKRHQDTVRGLGLLPLPEGEKRDSDLLDRYRVFQEFLRTSRRFGSQRQASEKLAVKIGMENLARTAGFPDPVRLEWAMEAQEVADLAGGSKTVSIGEVTLTLAINRWGELDLTVKKNGQSLRAVPDKLRKDPDVVELRTRRKELKRQVSRMRRSLEEAMGRGDQYSGAELRDLLTHPLLAPMLEHLVFLGDGIIGYPVDGGAALQSHDGTRSLLGDGTTLRIAHPFDLYHTGEWHLWQRECYLAEHIQPFKQVFRELYLLTEAEKADGTISRRYAGHQVNPRQALALLGQRGWVNIPEEGVRRTFHDAGISAWLTFVDGFLTPAEVEGLTLEGAQFTKRGEWEPLPLTDIPPRLFSQAMRDLDLVVSVAHQGGVDPEASASTVEMRASMVRETCTMLGITNVELGERHVLIDGSLSDYTIHLGSAIVHQQPGGAVCILPVHAQHRGRLFLPFADDDPKTAEVVSKVLLLAKDKEIKDPTILEQILSKPR